jgi:cobalt/nickel transport system ATP-binding protein
MPLARRLIEAVEHTLAVYRPWARLALAGTALIANAAAPPAGSAALGIAAIAGLLAFRARLRAIFLAAAVVQGSLLAGLAWLGGLPLPAALAVAARPAAGIAWMAWLAAAVEWRDVRRLVQGSAALDAVAELADAALAHGTLLLRSLERRNEVMALRDGRRSRSAALSRIGPVLAGGFAEAMDRARRLGEARALRAHGETPCTCAGPALRMREVSLAYADGTPRLIVPLLDLAPGEWIAVAGPSGSGKSTLLRAAAGLLPPIEGELSRLGMPLRPGPLAGRLDRRVALVLQNPDDQLIGATPLDDVAWGLCRRAVASADGSARAAAMLDLLGLGPMASVPLAHLSFGQRQRVALAAALVCEPQLLLCDEVTSGLDPVAARRLVRALEAAAEARPMAVIWVTHDLASLPARARRVVLVNAGRVVLDAPRALALAPSHLEAAGLLEPDLSHGPPLLAGAARSPV